MNISWQAAIILLICLVILVFNIWVNCSVLNKAGFSRWWVVLIFVPVVDLAAIWLFAFLDWPNLEADVET